MNNFKKETTEDDFIFFNKKEVLPQDSFWWDLIGISLSIILIVVFFYIFSESYESWSFHYRFPFIHHYL